MLNKVGTTLVTSTDSVLISSFISVAAVGIYGNYTTISKAVENVLYQGMYAMTASIGNLNVCGSRERKFQVFKTISFVIVWIYGFGCIALFGLLTPFCRIMVWHEHANKYIRSISSLHEFIYSRANDHIKYAD